MRNLAGKTAVVTGAASGIGLAVSRCLGADGMRVMMADVEEPALADAAKSLADEGIEVATTVTDVSDAESVDALASATLERFGAVHVVCNNAGVSRGGPSWEIPLPIWSWMIGVNVMGVVHGIRSFVPHLIAQGEGHVVNTASVGWLVAGMWMSPYFATKHAVIALSESLHHELSAMGSPVRVSVLCPGMVQTRIYESYRNWPAKYGEWPEPADAAAIAKWRQEAKSTVQAGVDPAIVAKATRDAIVSDQFWVLTHPEFADAITDRSRGAVEGRNPQLPAR
jgi:NAD(P)-dependent dehydrogenase (short-subunit alcohol dehydrogenase family)